MKKVTAFVGSARKRGSYRAARQFLDNLQARGDVETEIVALGDYRLETCRGCKVCFERGEERCPLKDDRDLLLGKIAAADGIVMVSPNYAFQVSALVKTLLERLGFAFHRPRFFGKSFTSIVVQGFMGGGKIERYLDFVGSCLGFNTVKGSCFTMREPTTAYDLQQLERQLAAHSERFHRSLQQPAFPAPSLFMLIGFRMGRTAMRCELDASSRDFQYYQQRGWFEADYFYPVRLGLVKKLCGRFLDWLQARLCRRRQSSASDVRATATC